MIMPPLQQFNFHSNLKVDFVIIPELYKILYRSGFCRVRLRSMAPHALYSLRLNKMRASGHHLRLVKGDISLRAQFGNFVNRFISQLVHFVGFEKDLASAVRKRADQRRPPSLSHRREILRKKKKWSRQMFAFTTVTMPFTNR